VKPETPVFVLWYDFTKWLVQKTGKFPKRVRFTFTNRIDNLALDVLQAITVTQYTRRSERKTGLLREINHELDQIRVLLRMCHDMEFLDHKGYEHASRKIDEAGRMIGGWGRQQEGADG